MWKLYKAELDFTGQLMGGIPKNADMIASWLEARAPKIAPPDAIPLEVLADQIAEEVGASEDEEAKIWTGFKSDENGLYIEGSNLKAHLKDGANILKDMLGIKALKAKLADRVHVTTEKIYLGVEEPNGYWEHAVHVMTRLGPRSALKRNDYVVKPSLVAEFRVLDDGVIKSETLENIFEFGGTRGFGAERGLGHGRYTYTLTEV